MKKNLALAAALLIAGGIFAQEYTIYLAGSVSGTISLQKDRGGNITVTPHINGDGTIYLSKGICPILPEESFSVSKYTKSFVIGGNTTNDTGSVVINGNTLTKTTTWPIDGWEKHVLNGNTVIRTFSGGDKWERITVTGNTMTQTHSYGEWVKVVINGNTTTVTGSYDNYEEVIRGNTRTVTYSNGDGYREVIDGNTITRTSLDGKDQVVVDKQGTDIFITATGSKYVHAGEMSEKDQFKSIITTITSGKIKDGLFDKFTLGGGA
jgi:hypothetical protein